MANIYLSASLINLILYSYFIYSVSCTGTNLKRHKKDLSLQLPSIVDDDDKHQEVGIQDLATIDNRNSQDSFEFPKMELKKFAQQCLDAHNNYRKKHNVPPLHLNKKLNEIGQMWAVHLAMTTQFIHKPNNIYGENLYMFSSNKNITKLTMSGSEPVDAWYTLEIPYFAIGSKYKDIVNTDYFTQIIWPKTKYLGVGVARGIEQNNIIVVCVYDPPANGIGEYATNIPSVGNSDMRPRKKNFTHYLKKLQKDWKRIENDL